MVGPNIETFSCPCLSRKQPIIYTFCGRLHGPLYFWRWARGNGPTIKQPLLLDYNPVDFAACLLKKSIYNRRDKCAMALAGFDSRSGLSGNGLLKLLCLP